MNVLRKVLLVSILLTYIIFPILAQDNAENSSRPRRANITGAPRTMEDVRKFEQAIARNKQIVGFVSYYYDGCYNLAALNALLGNKEEAIKWLEKAVEKGLIDTEIINNDPDIDSLKTEKNFSEILKLTEETKSNLARSTPFTVENNLQTDGKKKLPLLVVLHGETENASNLFQLWDSLAKKNQVVLIAPQALYTIGDGHYQWGTMAEGREIVAKAIVEAEKKYPVDTNKIYVMGFSQGATLALNMALSTPERFAGVIAVAPRYLHKLVALEKIKKYSPAVYLANGENEDPHILANNQLAKNLLTDAGLKVELKLFRNTGHAFPANPSLELEKALTWIEQNKKQ
ncbi:MAG: dienelactone hydrolase family protein [Acidobacteria bacterium]|nr:dienelactone hydrolase family protein [Acidobacteriota bacterium]